MSEKTTEEPRYKKRVAAIKKKLDEFKEDCEGQKGKKHTPLKLKNRMRSSRSGPYSKNGYFHIAGKKGRRAAYDLPVALLEQRLIACNINPRKKGMTRREQAQQYTFTFEPEGGLNNWLSSNKPYGYQAHHLIPDEALSEDVFTEPKWVQLQKLPYDINHGQNIMLLPSGPKARGVHLLPQHNGSHPAYNALVKADMAKVKGKLKNTDCENPTPPPLAVLDSLIGYQEDYWSMLKTEGAAALCTVNQAAQRQADGSAV
jgi:hypothetical protein